MTVKVVSVNSRELIGSPLGGVVGDIVKYNVTHSGTVVVDGQCYMKAFRGTQEVSNSILSGNMSGNANTVSLKVISGEVAGRYKYLYRISVNNQYIVFTLHRIVERETD
jgi:hypothetical protein